MKPDILTILDIPAPSLNEFSPHTAGPVFGSVPDPSVAWQDKQFFSSYKSSPRSTSGSGISSIVLSIRQGISSPSSRSEEHTSELQSRFDLVCRLLLEKKKLYIHYY